MSSNQAGEFHEIVFLENPVVKKTFINQTLIDNTLCTAGSSYRGPAFVPMHISNSTDDQNVANTLNNVIGKERQNSVGHLFDDLNYYKDTQSYHALSMWHQNGGQQSSFVRVLGIADGTKAISAGFNVENITTDLYHQNDSQKNKFTIQANLPDITVKGSVNFITRSYNTKNIKINDDVTLDSFEELGFSKNGNSYESKEFITDTIVCPEGVAPLFLEVSRESLNNFYSESLSFDNDIKDDRFSIATSVQSDEYPEFILRGFDPTAEESLVDSSNSKSNRSFFTVRKNNLSKPETYNSSWLNLFHSKIYENGHHLYSSYYDGDFLTLNNDYKILHVKPYEEINDPGKANYNDFEASYTTAKTPWIISQAINSVESTRENLHKNVIDLFRFHSLDDGEVGNRFRIKINLKKRGDANFDTYAKFDLFIMEYDPRDNSFSILESYENLDLNVNSTNYICRRIGTKRKYFDLTSKKVFKEGIYDNISQYLRVEINNDIELQKLRSDLIPCGFRAYPKLKYDDVFNNDSANIDFMPVPYYQNYLEDLPLGENSRIRNSWGVLFRHLDYNESSESISLKQISAQPNDISPHFYYTKFFKSENLVSDQTLLDESYNSIFSLEKLVVKKSLIDSVITEEDFTIFYKRSGKSLSSYNPGSSYKYEYIDFNKMSYIDDNSIRQYSIYQFDETNVTDTEDFNENLIGKLSFDFFTFGGFDGINIYDFDQRNLTAKSVSIEKYNNNSLITNAFEIAKELLLDYSNCNGDILIFPGMRELSFVRNVIDNVENENRFFYITDGIFDTVYDNILPYFNSIIARDFSSYYKDKSSFDVVGYYNNSLDIIDFERDILQNQFETTSLNSLGIDSKYCMSVIGNVVLVPSEINICPKIIDPSIFAASKMSQGIRNNITSTDFVYDNFNMTLINSTYLSQSNEFFELLNKNSRKNLFNILYHNLTDDLISLRSENTSYRIRRSIFSKQQFIRALQYVKKNVMLDLYTNEQFIPGGALFAQIASLQNVYARLKLQLTNLFNALVDADIISYYSLDIPVIVDDLAIIDMRNNIIRGSVTIKLNNVGTDDIIRLSIQNAINSFAYVLNVDNSIESEILLPASGI